MNDRFISMNDVLSLVGNLLKDVACKALQSNEFFLNCKGCKYNEMMNVDAICGKCMRNYFDKYEREENNG